jgi:hypothetical protein
MAFAMPWAFAHPGCVYRGWAALVDSSSLGLCNALKLALPAQVRLEFSEHPRHVEEALACRRAVKVRTVSCRSPLVAVNETRFSTRMSCLQTNRVLAGQRICSGVVYWGVTIPTPLESVQREERWAEEYDRIPSLRPNNSKTEIPTTDCHRSNAKAKQKSEPHNRFDSSMLH